ncbi:unnamed protein product [marine sediment metagenome]|uniref:Uncharacterized protein n=1 Tax=marine sediment metagenome TaxID=412755 RepID=X1JU99_9ZZZZ
MITRLFEVILEEKSRKKIKELINLESIEDINSKLKTTITN